jgi:putative transposase
MQMARLPRFDVPGYPQHLIQRGNNRSRIFFRDADYTFFLECLQDASLKQACDIHAYVLMTNHVHLLVTPQAEGSLSRLMQSVGRRYVQHINQARQRTGTLWEGRYRACPLESDSHLLTCYRYIELNPVRARMVEHPRHYRWSSYRHNALAKPDPLIREHPLYQALGRNAAQRCSAYQEEFRAQLGEAALAELRNMTNQGWALGSEPFRRRIERLSQRRAVPLPRGGRRKGAGRPAIKAESLINSV